MIDEIIGPVLRNILRNIRKAHYYSYMASCMANAIRTSLGRRFIDASQFPRGVLIGAKEFFQNLEEILGKEEVRWPEDFQTMEFAKAVLPDAEPAELKKICVFVRSLKEESLPRRVSENEVEIAHRAASFLNGIVILASRSSFQEIDCDDDD